MSYQDAIVALKKRQKIKEIAEEFEIEDGWQVSNSDDHLRISVVEGCIHKQKRNSDCNCILEMATQQSSSGLKLENLNRRWNALHNAFDFIKRLLDSYKMEYDESGSEFMKSKATGNMNFAITMLLLRKDYRLFILYLVLYLVERPDRHDENALNEVFSQGESFRELLEAVIMQDLPLYANLTKRFIESHPPHRKILYDDSFHADDVRKDFECLFQYLYQREYYATIAASKFNSYTAALITYGGLLELHFLEGFTEDLHLENGQCMDDKRMAQFIQMVGRTDTAQHSPYVAHMLTTKLGHYPDDKDNSIVNTTAELMSIFKKKAKQPFWLSIWASVSGNADIHGALIKSWTCFILQVFLYVAAAHIDTEELHLNVIDSNRWSEGFILAILLSIIFFTFLYAMNTSLTEFYGGTVAVFVNSHSWIQRALILQNFFVNSVLSMALIFLSTLILKTSESRVDILLNSVAVFFLLDLDDLLITSSDEHILTDRLLFSYIDILHGLGVNPKKFHTKLASCIQLEKKIIICLTCLGLSSIGITLFYFLHYSIVF